MTGYGLVLGGGGARGLAHLGVWKVLDEAGLPPAVVAGTSMGGLVGAFIAAGYSAPEVLRIARTVSWRQLLDWRPSPRLIRGAAMDSWLRAHLPPTFEELERPLALTATDLLTGRAAYLTRGDLYPAIRATIAYPGALEPVPLRGALLADGGILNQLPVDAALFLGASRVLAVDVTAPDPLAPRANRVRPWRRDAGLGTVQVLRRSVEIMQAQLTDARLSLYRPDVLLRPNLGDVSLLSFHRSEQVIQAGQEAAQAALPGLEVLRSPGGPA